MFSDKCCISEKLCFNEECHTVYNHLRWNEITSFLLICTFVLNILGHISLKILSLKTAFTDKASLMV